MNKALISMSSINLSESELNHRTLPQTDNCKQVDSKQPPSRISMTLKAERSEQEYHNFVIMDVSVS